MADSLPHLSVCIVNWNTRGELETCLRSIEATRGKLRVEVIVVDNASTDGSAEMVAERFPAVHLIRNADNRGFAAATNQALRARHADYALLLNPDIVVCPGALQALHHFLETTPDAGAVTGMLWAEDGRRRYSYQLELGIVSQAFLLADSLTWSVTGRLDRLIHPDSNGTVRRADMLMGGCMMVREEVIDQLGGLDESFFVWYEDADWCRRIRGAGWNLYFCPAATFRHEAGVSFRPWTTQRMVSQRLASFLIYADKHFPVAGVLFVRPLLIVNLALHLPLSLLARRLGRSRSKRALNWRDRTRWIAMLARPPGRVPRQP